MSTRQPRSRLCDISTKWSLVFEAHQCCGDDPNHAQVELMERYFGAVYRYLVAVVKKTEVAEDLSQEFAMRFVRGDFRRAAPSRGRFRDYVKASLQNLIKDHFASLNRGGLSCGHLSGIVDPDVKDQDIEFYNRWREELIEWAWQRLEEVEAKTGTPYYTILRWRAERPDDLASQFAAELGAIQCQSITESGVRQILRRSRIRFAELLVAEVAHSLKTSEPNELNEELAALDLLQYCSDSHFNSKRRKETKALTRTQA